MNRKGFIGLCLGGLAALFHKQKSTTLTEQSAELPAPRPDSGYPPLSEVERCEECLEPVAHCCCSFPRHSRLARPTYRTDLTEEQKRAALLCQHCLEPIPYYPRHNDRRVQVRIIKDVAGKEYLQTSHVPDTITGICTNCGTPWLMIV